VVVYGNLGARADRGRLVIVSEYQVGVVAIGDGGATGDGALFVATEDFIEHVWRGCGSKG